MSIWACLDLLNQFTNTRALSLLHNRMWQSRNSGVHVHLVQHCLLVTRFVTVCNGLPRSVTNCFVSNVETYAFMKRTCLGTIWHIICVCFNNGLPRSIGSNNGFHRSIIIICASVWLAWLGTFWLSHNFSFWSLSNFWTQFFHPIMFQKKIWRKVTHIPSR